MISDDPDLMKQPPGGTIEVMSARDGSRLRYGVWPVPIADRRGAVLLLHGRTEFIEKHFETIADLLARRFSVFTLDWRGQGLSDAMNGIPLKGHVRDYDEYLDDLDLFVRIVVHREDNLPFFVLGHSMGAHLALRYEHLHPEAVKGMIMCAPMIKLLGRRVIGVLSQIASRSLVAIGFRNNYIPGQAAYWEARRNFEGNPLTSDPCRYKLTTDWIDRNANLAVGPPTFSWLSAMFRSIAVTHQTTFRAAIITPVLIVAAGRDSVVSTDGAKEYSERLPGFEFVSIDGAQHEILHERDDLRDAFWAAFDQFVEEILSPS